MVEIYQLKPKPRRVAQVGEELFNEYLDKKRRLLKNDLGTDWFGRFLASLFTHVGVDDRLSFEATAKNGSSYTIYTMKNVSNYSFFNNTYYSDVGVFIAVGTSNTAPTKTDYALGNEVACEPATSKYNDGSDYVIVSASFTLAQDTDIYEVGLFYRMNYSVSSPYVCDVLLDRTVLDSPVTFPANTPMLVAYKIAI